MNNSKSSDVDDFTYIDMDVPGLWLCPSDYRLALIAEECRVVRKPIEDDWQYCDNITRAYEEVNSDE